MAGRCTDTYVEETARALATRVKEHTRTTAPLTAVGEHKSNHQHDISLDNVEVMGREDHFWNRKIREALEIKTQRPTLNRDAGYDLPAIYDDLLPLEHPPGGQHYAKCQRMI
ncbi:uncharacterized protein [Amphiura filiformis]|uniref:uncharacterized protein n=1 Tax=Amphiura filiformis TaxID=82378 RepID=UPI003B21777F